MTGNLAEGQRTPCDILEWDTSFFGFRVARVRGDVLTKERIQEIDSWCRQAGVGCLYFLSRVDDPNTTRLAEDNGFRLVDVRITMEYGAPEAIRDAEHQGDCAVVVRCARPEDVPFLRSIARESYHDTRFYFDVSFPRQLSDRLYETWITTSCDGYADAVFVAELEGVVGGYVTCHLDGGASPGRIGLFGVHSQARGRGIGHTLVRHALGWFSARGARKALVVTQGRNCAAQRLYQRCGFLTRNVQLWYHKWYSQPCEG